MESRMPVISSPRNTERIAGGASLRAETVVVGSSRDGDAQQVLVFVHGLQ